MAGAAVYLVASDSGAFGKNVLHEELRREAAANDAEVILITRTEDLIAEFATSIDVEIDTESLLGDEAVALAVSRVMMIGTRVPGLRDKADVISAVGDLAQLGDGGEHLDRRRPS